MEDEAERWKIPQPAAPVIDSRHASGALGTSSDPRLKRVEHLWLLLSMKNAGMVGCNEWYLQTN